MSILMIPFNSLTFWKSSSFYKIIAVRRQNLFRYSSTVAPTSSNKIWSSPLESIQNVIQSGQTILVGGFGLCGIPENLINAIKSLPNIKDLTVVSNNAGVTDFGLGLLLGTNQIKKMISSYVGENELFERQYLNGELEVELVPQGTLAEKLRAGGAGIPAFYTPTAVGTSLEFGKVVIKYDRQGNPSLWSKPKESKIFNGRKYLMEESINGDLALIKAWKGDSLGNLIFRKTSRNFNPVAAKAAKLTIAEVEEIVPVDSLDPEHIHLPGIYVDRIVKGPSFIKRIERLKLRNSTNNSFGQDEDSLKRDRIIKRAAEEIKNGMYVNLGIGMPMLTTNYIPSSCTAQLQTENGLLGLGPYPLDGEQDPDLINAGKETVTAAVGASFFGSDESFAMIRGGHVSLTILGAMEVSAKGDLANWIIPGKMVKGMGGAMDLASSQNTRVVITMEHVSKVVDINGRPKILNECKLPLTAQRCVNRIVTDMCVFDISPNDGLILTEVFKNISLEQIKKSTEATFKLASEIRTIDYY